jgi:hypothetical protein
MMPENDFKCIATPYTIQLRARNLDSFLVEKAEIKEREVTKMDFRGKVELIKPLRRSFGRAQPRVKVNGQGK